MHYFPKRTFYNMLIIDIERTTGDIFISDNAENCLYFSMFIPSQMSIYVSLLNVWIKVHAHPNMQSFPIHCFASLEGKFSSWLLSCVYAHDCVHF